MNQGTSQVAKEPLQVLARNFKGKISFGLYLNRNEHDSGQYLNIGCKIIARKC